MPTEIAVIGGVPRLAVLAPPPPREAHGPTFPDRRLTVDCGQRGRTPWTRTHAMDELRRPHQQLMAKMPDSQGLQRTVESASQADSAGSIPVTRSNVKAQVRDGSDPGP